MGCPTPPPAPVERRPAKLAQPLDGGGLVADVDEPPDRRVEVILRFLQIGSGGADVVLGRPNAHGALKGGARGLHGDDDLRQRPGQPFFRAAVLAEDEAPGQ